MLEDFLGLYGYEMLAASHPDTAFKRLNQSADELDAVILDVNLDDNRSGIEVLELLRLDERFVDLPVIVLTGTNLTADEARAIERNRAYLFRKDEGYERVFNRLSAVLAPLGGRGHALPRAGAAR